jgi:hypothetical protein
MSLAALEAKAKLIRASGLRRVRVAETKDVLDAPSMQEAEAVLKAANESIERLTKVMNRLKKITAAYGKKAWEFRMGYVHAGGHQDSDDKRNV